MEIRQIKHLFIALFSGVCSFALHAQTSFYNVYSGDGYDKGEGIAQLPDSGFLVTGSSSSFEEAPSQIFLMRIDSLGNFVWSKAYGGTEFEEGKRVMIVPGYGYYIAGTSSSGVSADFDAYLLFTDEAGNQQWDQFTDNGGWERVHDAILLADTSVVIVGETNATSNGNTDLFLGRYDKEGNLLWSQQWGTDGEDIAYSVVSASDTSVVVGGTWYVADSLQNKGTLLSVHIDGSLIWQKTFGIEGNYRFNDVYSDGSVIKAIGERIKTGKTDHDSYTATTDMNGTLTGSEEYYMDDDTRYVALALYANGGGKFFMGSQSINPNIPTFEDGEDCYLSRYTSGLYWDGYGMGYNGTGQDQINDLVPTSDGYAVSVGFHTSYGSGGNSVFVVKIGDANSFPESTVTPTIINIVFLSELTVLKGLNVFPNPVNNQLTVEVPGTTFTYSLTDANGKILQTGNTVWEQSLIDFSSQTSGVYFLRITHESGESAVVKIVK